MEKRPLFAFGAALFTGTFAAGLRPWYLTYFVLIGVPSCCVIYTIKAIYTFFHARRGGGNRERADGGYQERAGGSSQERVCGSYQERAGGGSQEWASSGNRERADGSYQERAVSGYSLEQTSGSSQERVCGSYQERAGGVYLERADGGCRERTGGSLEYMGGNRQERMGNSHKERISGGLLFRIVLFSAITAVLPVIAYKYCVNAWKSNLSLFSEQDGEHMALDLRISSPVERKGGYLRVQADVMAPDGKPYRKGVMGRPVKVLMSAEYEIGSGGVEQGGGGQSKKRRDDEASGVVGARDGESSEQDGGGLREKWRYGTVVRAYGKIVKPAPQQNEYLFDYQTYMYAKGTAASFYTADGDVSVVTVAKEFWGIPLDPIGAGIAVRNRIDDVFSAVFPPKEAALLAAMLIGKTDGLDGQMRDDFKAAGLLHLTAVSGLHVALIAGLVAKSLRKAGFGLRIANAASLAAMGLFVFIAGFSASVVRAAIAFLFASVASFFGLDYDSPSAIGFAAIIILFYNPMQVFATGFILSFSSALSIIFILPVFKNAVKNIKIPRAVTDSLGVSAAVVIGSLPIQATLFHQFSKVSILSNLASAPIIAVLLGAGILTAATGLAAIAYAGIPALFAVNFIWALEKIASISAGLPDSLARIGEFTPQAFVLYYVTLASAVMTIKRRKLSAAPVLAACLAIIIFVVSNGSAGVGADGMEVVFLDVGNSNAAYINIGGKYNMLVDAGGATGSAAWKAGEAGRAAGSGGRVESAAGIVGEAGIGDRAAEGAAGGAAGSGGVAGSGNAAAGIAGVSGAVAKDETRLFEYLAGRGVGSVDVAVATHGDSDHIQGYWYILDSIPVRRFVIPVARNSFLDELAEFAAAKGAEVVECGAGDAILIGADAVIQIISPSMPTKTYSGLPGYSVSSNDDSLVTRVVFGEMKALFCGDISTAVESELVSRAGEGGLDAQLMSVPHHGSRFSSSEAFLGAVSPQAAVAGVGKNNYGHPAADAVKRYSDAGIPFLRTDRDGMVSVLCNRTGIVRIKCYNDIGNKLAWQR